MSHSKTLKNKEENLIQNETIKELRVCSIP